MSQYLGFEDLTVLLLLPGITQWALVLPLIVFWSVKGHRESCKGVVLVAGLVMLGNFLCMAALPYTWPTPSAPI